MKGYRFTGCRMCGDLGCTAFLQTAAIICGDCYKRATIVELTGAALLRQQGYEVMQSALNRTGVPIRGPIEIANHSGFELGIIAIGDNAARMRIARSLNLHWLRLVHSAAWVDPDAKLGTGTVVFAGAIIQAGQCGG
jgi:hypothetical protein